MIVILENLQDPGNVGTILRTADSAGATAVICTRGTADIYSAKVVRSTMGSLLHLPVCHVESVQAVADLLHHQGVSCGVSCRLDRAEHRSEKRVFRTAKHHANGIGLGFAQIAGAGIRDVVELLHCLHHLGADTFSYVRMVVKYARYGGDGNTTIFRYILNGHKTPLAKTPLKMKTENVFSSLRKY